MNLTINIAVIQTAPIQKPHCLMCYSFVFNVFCVVNLRYH